MKDGGDGKAECNRNKQRPSEAKRAKCLSVSRGNPRKDDQKQKMQCED